MENSPAFPEAFRFWLKLGCISFGGPTGQIAIMHEELVERRQWISDSRFLHALNYCMLLPGPEAQQLAIYVGWLLHGIRGGICAGALFVLPSAILLWALSWIYVVFGRLPMIMAIFSGLKPAVVAIVAAAIVRLGKKGLRTPPMWTVAFAGFIAIYAFHLPFPIIIMGAAAVGFIGAKLFVGAQPGLTDAHSPVPAKPPFARTLKICAICLLLWWVPVLAAGWLHGWQGELFRQGVFFSKAAMVTFGGAYAVLPYVAQQAVQHYHWLDAGQMLDGLALAETTPGPLIIVLQYVGFLGAWSDPGALSPLVAATLGAFLTTWTTFVPCFLWIFLGAPYIEQLRNNAKLSAALSAITAAVVGVMLNLAILFASRALIQPTGGFNRFAIVVSVVALVGVLRWKWNAVPIILVSGLAGLIFQLAMTRIL